MSINNMKNLIPILLKFCLLTNEFQHGLSFTTVYRKHLIYKRRVCTQSQGRCGSLCFDTKIYTCHSLQGKRPFLCHREDLICGDNCYDPTEKTCYGSGEDAVACQWGFRVCPSTGQCYDTKLDSLTSCSSSQSLYYSISSNNNNWDNRQSSWKQQSWDGNQQQNSQQNQQQNKPTIIWNNMNSNTRNPSSSYSNYMRVEPKQPTIISSSCGMGNKMCGAICYDLKRQICFGEQNGPPRLFFLVCPKGNKRCGNSCYDPSSSRCSTGGDYNSNSNSNQGNNNYCSYGQVACGNRCIYPNEESCNNEYMFSSSSSSNNNNKWSKDSNGNWNTGSSQNSNSWSVNNGNNGCGSGLSKCGTICYDPFKQSCLGNNESDRLLCETGQEACGKKCYDPFNQRCINIGSGGGDGTMGGSQSYGGGGNGMGGKNSFSNGEASKKLIICKWNESACGAKCYDPQKGRCNGNSMGSSTSDF